MKTAALVLFVLVVLGGVGWIVYGEVGLSPAPPTPVELAAEHPGAELYRAFKCFQCHGVDLTGTHKAPPLFDVGDHWSKEQVVRLLLDPEEFAANDRIVLLQAQYAPVSMPSYPATPEQLGVVAEYLIEITRLSNALP